MKVFFPIRYLLVFFMLAAVSCEYNYVDYGFSIGKEENFQLNRQYTSADGQYTLKITEISDSRCPEGVECIWSGEVNIKGEFTEVSHKSPFEIHSVVGQENKQPEGFTIQIIDAKPYPKYGTESKPENLVVTLLIQKK